MNISIISNFLKTIRFKKSKLTCISSNFKFTKKKKKSRTITPISFDQKFYNAIDKNFNLQIKHFQYQLP